jgi:hypothetical protein
MLLYNYNVATPILDMQAKNHSFWTNIGSKTTIIDFSAHEFFVRMAESYVFFLEYILNSVDLGLYKKQKK